MAKDESSLRPNLQSSFQELAAIAADLNFASDQLTNYAELIGAHLNSLHLGVDCWVTISTRASSDDGAPWIEELGYSKVSGKWGLALRNGELDDTPKYWRFGEAPREMRINAINALPKLMEELIKASSQLRGHVNSQLEKAERVVAATLKQKKSSVANVDGAVKGDQPV